MITATLYSADDKPAWDSFVVRARNGSFKFLRDYQEYHRERFPDNSYLFRRDGDLIALLPASRNGSEISSHGGLTFGGVLMDTRMTTPLMLEVFDVMLARLRQDGFKRLVYKATPPYYNAIPSDEDLYALTRHGARLFRRDVGSVLRLGQHPEFQERRRRAVKKAEKAGVIVRESHDFVSFWAILEENLKARHGVAPVHTLKEILLLHQHFPGNIQLFAAFANDRLLGGTVVFVNPLVVHAQYIAASSAGREVGALDLVFSELITRIFVAKTWFSFGISTESGGSVLNQGLIEYKEGFGARAYVHDFYEINL